MTLDSYIQISCPNCESQFAVEFLDGNVTGQPDFCPFCGEEIPEEDNDEPYKDDDEKDILDEY